MNPALLRATWTFGLLSAATGAWAHQTVVQPTAAESCLVSSGPTVKPLIYPENAYQRKDSGTVSVQLIFTAPDAAPSHRLLNDWQKLPTELMDAVRSHVRQFRMPCLVPGAAPVVLRQDYVFIPNDGRKVVATLPALRSGADGERPYQPACSVNIREAEPEYPRSARNEEMWGPVLVTLRFDQVAAPPQVTTLSSPHGRLSSAVSEAAQRLRLTCRGEPAPGELPKTILATYLFKIADGPTKVLKDIDLVDFIRGSTGYATPVYFDTTRMARPFDVHVTYYRPHADNVVKQLEAANPARQPLLDWLRHFTLKLPERIGKLVIGDTMTVSIPCGSIDL